MRFQTVAKISSVRSYSHNHVCTVKLYMCAERGAWKRYIFPRVCGGLGFGVGVLDRVLGLGFSVDGVSGLCCGAFRVFLG